VHLAPFHFDERVSRLLDFDHVGLADILVQLVLGVCVGLNLLLVLLDGQLPHPFDDELVGLTRVLGILSGLLHLFLGLQLLEALGLLQAV